MRLPLAPATLRAGGWISAGMISVVQMPLPIRAAMAPSDWPQRCAPSPESLMISTMCSVSVSASRSSVGSAGARVASGARVAASVMVAPASCVIVLRRGGTASRCRRSFDRQATRTRA